MSQLIDYNEFVENNLVSLVRTFSPCSKSNIRRPVQIFFEHDDDVDVDEATNFSHAILNIFKLKRGSYFTCIEFMDNIECKQQHICDIFPVMFGSELDKSICRLMMMEGGGGGGGVAKGMPNSQCFSDLSGAKRGLSPTIFSTNF